MKKAEALGLQPGDGVIFGRAQQTQHCHERLYGEVHFVTRNGGIRLRNARGVLEWIPYHHVIRRAGPDDKFYDTTRN